MQKHTLTKASNICVQGCACVRVCIFSGGCREHLFTPTKIKDFPLLHLFTNGDNKQGNTHMHTRVHIHSATC